jgi:hypothetical protein
MSKSREMSIRTIGVPTYNHIPHLPDIRQMQQLLCDKIGSNFSKKTATFVDESCNSRLEGTQQFTAITYACNPGTAINSTNVYNFHVKCRLMYQ